MMITHDPEANKRLAEPAEEEETSLPVTPGAQQMQAHQHGINLFQRGTETAQSDELQRFAALDLPLLQAHLQIAQMSAQELGIDAPVLAIKRRALHCHRVADRVPCPGRCR